jgi:hypothetical protein
MMRRDPSEMQVMAAAVWGLADWDRRMVSNRADAKFSSNISIFQ